jgi:UDP-glucose 4-epimerase
VNILVTGGAGFIGSHIVDAYIAAGHRVVIADDLSTGLRENLNPSAQFVELDIRDDRSVEDLFKSEQFDVLNHQAAQMDVRRSVTDPAFDASVNVIGMLHLLECCVRYGVRKVVFASSGGAIYGEQEYFPADEKHPLHPISPYGVAKLTTENYLHYYDVVHRIKSVCLRYGNVYGPRQNPKGEAGVIAIFASKMLGGEEPIVNGDGSQTRDYVFIADVVQANVLALGCSTSDAFNVGTGIETNVNELFQHVKKLTRSPAGEEHGPAKAGEQRRSVLSNEKIASQLGWKQSVSLSDGLAKTVEFFRTPRGNG